MLALLYDLAQQHESSKLALKAQMCLGVCLAV